jgi:branched-chain amino acid transport system permease protein
MDNTRRTYQLLWILVLAVFAAYLSWMELTGTDYQIRILITCAIFVVFAVSYNLINGVTGQFSLGPNAFAAVGAYTAALLTLSPAEKELSFIIDPLVWPLNIIHAPFVVALLAGGFLAALLGFLTGFPVFRTRGDYLAIVTLGFGEVVVVIATNAQSVTNGPLGLKAIEDFTNLWWAWGAAVITIFVISRLVHSSYGLALKAIKYDEAAAESIGINTFWHKMMSFTFSAFFAGIGGGLLAHLITTISPTLFTFFLTFNILIMIVLGGLGSTTGAVIAAVLITWGGEALRFVEEPMTFGSLEIPGIPGMRMVLFSFLLIIMMIFARRGLMGSAEFSWDWVFTKIKSFRRGAS